MTYILHLQGSRYSHQCRSVSMTETYPRCERHLSVYKDVSVTVRVRIKGQYSRSLSFVVEFVKQVRNYRRSLHWLLSHMLRNFFVPPFVQEFVRVTIINCLGDCTKMLFSVSNLKSTCQSKARRRRNDIHVGSENAFRRSGLLDIDTDKFHKLSWRIADLSHCFKFYGLGAFQY